MDGAPLPLTVAYSLLPSPHCAAKGYIFGPGPSSLVCAFFPAGKALRHPAASSFQKRPRLLHFTWGIKAHVGLGQFLVYGLVRRRGSGKGDHCQTCSVDRNRGRSDCWCWGSYVRNRRLKKQLRAQKNLNDVPRRRKEINDLELEIFKFMESSDKPNSFPTKEELTRAGRSDLVEAILAKGGWLTAGWDLESEDEMALYSITEANISDVPTGYASGPDGLGRPLPFQDGVSENNLGIQARDLHTHLEDFGVVASKDPKWIKALNKTENIKALYTDGETVVASGPNHEEDVMSNAGKVLGDSAGADHKGEENKCKFEAHVTNATERMPDSRLKGNLEGKDLHPLKAVTDSEINAFRKDCEAVERKRGWERVARLFGLATSQQKPEHDRGTVLPETRIASQAGQTSSAVSSSGVVHVVGAALTHSPPRTTGKDKSSDIKGQVRRKKRHLEPRRQANNVNTVINSVNQKLDRRRDWMQEVESNSKENFMSLQHNDGLVPFSSRVHGLESRLAAMLSDLQSGRNALMHSEDTIKKIHDRAVAELARASDALEFHENEIMRTRAELRTTRAQMAAQEGKMALERMEAHKVMDEKDKKLEETEKVLRLLRTARIVWSNPASEVLLAGSFDGWTSRRKMAKSNAGVFVATLQLHPGRYEIKFVVDGIWRVDPHRPVVYANGIENNVLRVR